MNLQLLARRLFASPLASRRTKPLLNNLEALEDRTVPAFDLLLSAGSASANVTATPGAGTTTFEAIGAGAVLNAADIAFELSAGNNVVITTGAGGAEAGSITRDFDTAVYNAADAGLSLTYATGTGGAELVGDMSLPAWESTANPVALVVRAQGSVALGGTATYTTVDLSSANGSITSSAGAAITADTLRISSGTFLIGAGGITANITVDAGATLGGNGTINGNVTGAGTVAPGASPGLLVINGDFTPLGNLVFEVNPPADDAGVNYDQIQVNGAVDLSGATLSFSGATGAVAPNQVVTLIDNDLLDLVMPPAAPASGSTVSISGTDYRIFYNSGTPANNVVLVEGSTPTTVYVDDDFDPTDGAIIADADAGTAGAQPAIYGINAFTTIAAAQIATTAGGTIIVNAGGYAEAVSLAGTQTLRIGGADVAQAVSIDSLATIAGTTVQLAGTSSLTVGDATDTTIAGPITGGGSLVKEGSGTLTLSATNTYTGTTTINDGTLLVNGSITSNTTVTSPGTLGGSGTITGDVGGTGTVAPGNSPGVLAIIGNFTPLGDVAFEVNPPTLVAGTDFDQITVTGDVDLTAATLTFTGAAGAVGTNLLATIISNNGPNPTLPGAPAEGAVVTIAGTDYFVFYNGGDGDDVVLVEATTPTNVFVNDDWAGLNDGVIIADVDPLVAGPQAGIKGVNAFSDIAPAIAAVAVGGTIEVLGNSAAGYGGFTLSKAATFVLARDTFFVGGQGTITINGAVDLDGQDFTPTLNQGAGLVNLATTAAGTITGTSGTPSVAVTTTVASTGSVSLGGEVTAVLGVSLGAAGTALDTITLAVVNTGAGGITSFSNGITTLNADLSTDGGAVALSAAGGVRTTALIAIDTEQGDDDDAGDVNLSAASISSTAAGSNFAIHTGTAFVGGTAGAVTLGGFNSAGGEFIQNLTIDASADTRGDITLGGAAQIGGDLIATGANIVSNATLIAGPAAANTITLNATGDVTDGNGTALNFVVTFGSLNINYTTGAVEADTDTTNFLANGDGNLTIRETDSINLQGVSFGATNVFDLTTGAGGNVTQDAAVIGGSLRLTTGAGGTVTLADANDLDTLAANVQGTTFINDVDDLIVGTVTTTDGVNTNGNDLTLATGNLLTIGDAVGGTDNIVAAGAIVDLFTAADGILEANAAGITASSLRVAGTGTQFELANVNTVSTFVANTTGGTLRFNNGTTPLTIGSVTLNTVTTDGVTTDGENVTLASGALSVAQVVDAGAGDARFTTQGGVTQAAAITAVNLGVNNTIGGDVDLDGATNQITTFAASTTTGFVDLLNGLALAIGSVAADAPLFAAVDGITTAGGNVDVTTTGAGSTLAVNSNVASNGGDIGFTTSAGQTLAANVAAAAGDINLTAATGGVNQTAGGATGTDITLAGVGTFNLNSLTNDTTGVFAAGISGELIFRDANDLTLRPVLNAVSTGGNNATLFAGEDFTADSANVVLVNAGGGAVRIVPGAGAAATVATTFTFNAEVIGSSATFGSDPAAPAAENSSASTKFRVAASGNTLITVFGSTPFQAQVGPGVLGDSITPVLSDPQIKTVSLVLDPAIPSTVISGTYTITMQNNSVRLLRFRQMESLGDLGYRAIVAQTGNMQYSIRLQMSQPTPFPGSVTGQALQSSPFVVSPNILNIVNTYTAPTVAFGRVNEDGVADLIIANGSNDTPQVTVIDGRALFTGQPLNLGSLPSGAIIAQFYAFVDAQGQPTFRGGLHVAAKSNGPNTPADIVLGPGPGGGPAVQTFRLINNVMTQTSSFFAFESSFRGGVTVATGDYDNDGVDDIIVGTGPGGGPRVQVFKSGDANAQIANFFAYDAGFRGGVFVAAGNFDGAGGDDIATAPGYGGGPHVRVFRNNAGAPQEIASFFAWSPTTTNGLQLSGTNANNGIGSISFGAPIRTGGGVTDGSGRQEILVGSNRGTALQLRRFTFAPGATSPIQGFGNPLNLYNELTQPGAVDEFGMILNGIPIVDPMTGQPLSESQLFDGGSVAGFAG